MLALRGEEAADLNEVGVGWIAAQAEAVQDGLELGELLLAQPLRGGGPSR